jgi:hypothetical protein
MADYLSFLTRNMGGLFYSYFNTSTVASLCETNKEIARNICTYMKECKAMKKKPFQRSPYYENKYRTGFITYTNCHGIRVTDGGNPVWNITARPCDPNGYSLMEKLIIKQGLIKDPYCLYLYDVYGGNDLGHYMSKEDADAICESFKWWLDRKMAWAERVAQEDARAVAKAEAEAERKKKIFPLRTSATVTNPWKKV